MKLKLIADLKPRDYSLDDICRKRKRILIKRDAGGLGDIFVHRMIFEDFKLLMPDCHITFAIPQSYFQSVCDHPFIDEIVDCEKVDERDFLVSYTTTTACVKYEMTVMPLVDKHRSDIWAEHCGVNLTRHNMHVRFSDSELSWADSTMKNMNPDGKPVVLVAPITAMSSKNLYPEQIMPVVNELKYRGFYVFALHYAPMPQYDMPLLMGINHRQFMAIVSKADYLITADTAAFHLAGGLSKPTVLVTGWADGKILGKYHPCMALVQKHREDIPEWTCGPCHNPHMCCMEKDKRITRKPCLTDLTSGMILSGFDELLTR